MIWDLLAASRYRDIKRNLSRPAETQRRLLQEILRQLHHCQIARDLRIDRATSLEQFRSTTPVTDYSFYRPYVSKILAGTRSVLFPGSPVCVAQTGGTTSTPKQIPLGRNLIRSYRQFNLDMAFCYMQDSGHRDILSDRIFVVVASPSGTTPIGNVPVGRATGVMAQIAPWPLRRRYVPAMSVILNTDINQRIQQTTASAFHHRNRVRMAAGLTPYLVSAFSNLVRYARDEDLQARTVSEIFPKLRVAFHGGSAFDFYLRRMQTLTGDAVEHRNVYSAAEGPIAFQLTGKSHGLTPALDQVFLEFLSAREETSGNPSTFLVHEVECGVPYYILLTTQGGLLRYKIGDRVQFIEKHPPLLQVLGRAEDQIDLAGEKLTVHEATDALADTGDALGLQIRDFLVCPALAPTDDGPVAQEWIIECKCHACTAPRISEILDNALIKQNARYAQLRDHGFALGPPGIRLVSEGTFERHMVNELVYGQQKLIHLHNDRVAAERLLSYD